MESEEIKSQQDEDLSAEEVEEEAHEDGMDEESQMTADELLAQSAARLLHRRAYSDDPPIEITEEHVSEINEIPCTQLAADFVTLVDENIQLADLQHKAARRIEKLRYLQEANRAKRCEHIKTNGENCSGPALRGERFCRFHFQSFVATELPVIEDRHSLQLAFSQLARATASASIAPAQARVLMQILDKAGRYLPEEKPDPMGSPFDSLARGMGM